MRKPSRKQQVTIIALPFGEKFKEMWDMWKLYLKSEKQIVYNTFSEDYQLRRLVKYSQNNEDYACLMIEHSINCHYRGIFPPAEIREKVEFVYRGNPKLKDETEAKIELTKAKLDKYK